jgi:hypothetical protein
MFSLKNTTGQRNSQSRWAAFSAVDRLWRSLSGGRRLTKRYHIRPARERGSKQLSGLFPSHVNSPRKNLGNYQIGENRQWRSRSGGLRLTKQYYIRPAREHGSKQRSLGLQHEIRLRKELRRPTFFAGKLKYRANHSDLHNDKY